jgi:hypothetical protein
MPNVTDVLREDLIRQGLDPDHRRAWEELLNDKQRAEIHHAIREGER